MQWKPYCWIQHSFEPESLTVEWRLKTELVLPHQKSHNTMISTVELCFLQLSIFFSLNVMKFRIQISLPIEQPVFSCSKMIHQMNRISLLFFLLFLQVSQFRQLYSKVINDKHDDVMAKFGAILAQGILDAGKCF